MNSIQALTALGQSIWYDNIERRLLEKGQLAAMIARGDIRGVTSNPSIFQNAIANSRDYDSALTPLAWAGWTPEPIFWQLAVEDIQAACDLFRPLYEESNGGDGYVSLEVSPYLAHKTEETVQQAVALWERVDRPNLMIKIPATPAGLPAIRQAIASGININVTLIFSIQRYREVAEAYISGLEDRLQKGQDISRIASVASFFVSRIDSKVDALLPPESPWRGKAAVASAKLVYQAYLEIFSAARFERLKAQGARVQRPLWASTSTKNPSYPDTLYVEALIGPDTVNTVPPKTLAAFKDHGTARLSLTEDIPSARQALDALQAAGISMDMVTQELEDEGVQKFAAAFTDLLATIDQRRREAVDALGDLWTPAVRRLAEWKAADAPRRIWQPDPAFWTEDPAGQDEIRIRTGWLDSPIASQEIARAAQGFAQQMRAEGLRKALLIGMGGSSLAPEVISQVFAGLMDDFTFAILDSTHPEQVAAAAQAFPPAETLYLIASKSGTTAEVRANLDYFWRLSGQDGRRFVAITDPGSPLEGLARERGFRRVFLAHPMVGGRYSALTAFGLVPAALMGVDVMALLARAAWMRRQSLPEVPAARNPGLVLGAVLGEAALAGRDKITFFADPPFETLANWLEQLLAESTGKQGKGLVPVWGGQPQPPEYYAEDRLSVYFRVDGRYDEALRALHESGQPLLCFNLAAPEDLAAEFYRWEMATAAACAVLGVNAFDQPNVQDAKVRAQAQMAAFRAQGHLERPAPQWQDDHIQIYASQGGLSGETAADILAAFLQPARRGRDYVALNAFLPRHSAMEARLKALRLRVERMSGCAVTCGFGPRFLHSTGQLHKGGPASGHFIMLTAEPRQDFEIPGQGLSFGTLLLGQALGDLAALEAQGRRVLWLHFDEIEKIDDLLS